MSTHTVCEQMLALHGPGAADGCTELAPALLAAVTTDFAGVPAGSTDVFALATNLAQVQLHVTHLLAAAAGYDYDCDPVVAEMLNSDHPVHDLSPAAVLGDKLMGLAEQVFAAAAATAQAELDELVRLQPGSQRACGHESVDLTTLAAVLGRVPSAVCTVGRGDHGRVGQALHLP